MNLIRILVDSFADEDGINAQMTNAREIMSRLDPNLFHISTFHLERPDKRLIERPAARLIQLPKRRQTPRILTEFFSGKHDILFYIKPSPAARVYLKFRRKWFDRRMVIGMVESQSDLRNEPTVKAEQIHLWERTVLRSDFLFSNSSSVKASLQKEYGLSSEVVPTGVDTKFFTPAGNHLESRRVRVLFVGSLRPFKGPQLLMLAAARFPAADFVIAGDGIMRGELQEKIRSEHLSNVELTGALDRSTLREQYRRADIFLFPSRWEGSPKVISEAAACGLPVVARRDYQPETVVDGRTGFLGSSDDELLDQLEKLISNPSLRHEMGCASREYIERFDWDPIVRRWEKIFRELMDSRRRTKSA
jgi:glycosyltransferase involved in cell wall biosynthesis